MDRTLANCTDCASANIRVTRSADGFGGVSRAAAKTRQAIYVHGLYQSFSNPNASFWSANNLLKARFPRAVKLSTASTLIAITIAISGLAKPSILRRITAYLCRSGNCSKAANSATDRACC